MCGRFTNQAKYDEIEKEFKVASLNSRLLPPRFNIAPTQPIEVVSMPESVWILSQLRWGLIPFWAKDEKIGNKLINARAETLSEKPSFREAFKSRRCIIPASGFYEWKKQSDGAKQPFYFFLKDKKVFGFAGLWESWIDQKTGGRLESCAIVTTEANETLKPVHDRMPVILKPENYTQWLDAKENDTEKLQKFLAPYPADRMDSYAVSKRVNNPESDSPELIQPLNSF